MPSAGGIHVLHDAGHPFGYRTHSSDAKAGAKTIKYRTGRLQPCAEELLVASWNIEGLTNEKLTTLQLYMMRLRIGILSIQETHKNDSQYFETDGGFLVILSGEDGQQHHSSGVGFIIAPWLRKSVIGFCQASSRIASLKLRVQGGKAVLFSAYAPHFWETIR